MALGSFLHRGMYLAGIGTILLGCSTDALIPVASVDKSNRVSAIGPLELEGRVGSKRAAQSVPTNEVAAASDVPADPNALVAVPPQKKLPMIDSDEAAGLNTSMGVQPLQVPTEQGDISADEGTVPASTIPNIAEKGTSQPIVDGIGTDTPQLVASAPSQSASSTVPITWSDSPVIGGDVADQSNEAGPVPQDEQQLAFVPKTQNLISQPADPEPQMDAGPAPMNAADIQCRRDLQALGVQFQDLAPISQGPSCGIPHPISVTGFDRGNIRLLPTATLNCQVTLQFAKWIRNELVPSARLRYWSGVKSIRQMSAYSCRRMNSDPNNPWSEHAKGNAIDIGTITLNNGHEIDVEKKGIFSFNEGALLNAVRSDSCKYFDTVLGPGSNRYHKDHFHFDLRERRGGRKHCD